MPKLILQRLKTELKTGASKRSLSKAGGFSKKFLKDFRNTILGPDRKDQSTAHRIVSVKDHKWSQFKQTDLYLSFYHSL